MVAGRPRLPSDFELPDWRPGPPAIVKTELRLHESTNSQHKERWKKNQLAARSRRSFHNSQSFTVKSLVLQNGDGHGSDAIVGLKHGLCRIYQCRNIREIGVSQGDDATALQAFTGWCGDKRKVTELALEYLGAENEGLHAALQRWNMGSQR